METKELLACTTVHEKKRLHDHKLGESKGFSGRTYEVARASRKAMKVRLLSFAARRSKSGRHRSSISEVRRRCRDRSWPRRNTSISEQSDPTATRIETLQSTDGFDIYYRSDGGRAVGTYGDLARLEDEGRSEVCGNRDHTPSSHARRERRKSRDP